jgi:hypothetical protein
MRAAPLAAPEMAFSMDRGRIVTPGKPVKTTLPAGPDHQNDLFANDIRGKAAFRPCGVLIGESLRR